MITSSVNVRDDFGELTDAIDRDTIEALNEAARAGHAVAEQRSEGTGTDWQIVSAHATHNGFVSGLRARGQAWRVFNKGSLGKRTAPLRQSSRRKDYWTVKRGDNPYTARRGDVAGKGVAGKDISNPTRTAGRQTLISRIGDRIRR